MLNARRSLLVLCSLMIMVGGCLGTSRVKVSKILSDPGKYNNKQVVVKGKVVQTFGMPILGLSIVKIDDGSGEIWVKPRSRVPFEGETIKVKGTLKIGLTLANHNFGHIVVEKEEK